MPSTNCMAPRIGHSAHVISGNSSQTTTSNDSARGSYPLPVPDCMDAMELFLRPPTAKKAPAPRSGPAHPMHGSEAQQCDQVRSEPPSTSLRCTLNASDPTACVQTFQHGPRCEETHQPHSEPECIRGPRQASNPLTGAQTCIAADEFTLSSSFAIPIIPPGAVHKASSAVHTRSAYNLVPRFDSSNHSHAPLSATRQRTVFEGPLGGSVTGRASLAPIFQQVDLSQKVRRSHSLGAAKLASTPWAKGGVTNPAWGWRCNGRVGAGISQAGKTRLAPGLHSHQLGQVIQTSIHADIASHIMAGPQGAGHTPAAHPHAARSSRTDSGEPACPADVVAIDRGIDRGIDLGVDLASTSSSASSVCAAELLSCRKIEIGAMRRAEQGCDASASSAAGAEAGGISSAYRPTCTPRVIYRGGSIAASEMAANCWGYAGRSDSSNHGNAPPMVCEGGAARPRASEATSRPPPISCHLTPNHLSHMPTAASIGGAREHPRESSGGGRAAKAAGAWAQWSAPTHALEVGTQKTSVRPVDSVDHA